MTQESDEYRLVPVAGRPGEWDVFRKEGPTMRVLQFGSYDQGMIESATKLQESMAKYPYFRFSYAGIYEGRHLYHVDVDCGMQRWIGKQPARAVAKALRCCGFDPRAIMREARKTVRSWMGQVCY